MLESETMSTLPQCTPPQLMPRDCKNSCSNNTRACATDGGMNDGFAHHWKASVALWICHTAKLKWADIADPLLRN